MSRKSVYSFLAPVFILLLAFSTAWSAYPAYAQTGQSPTVIVTQNPVRGKILTDANGISLYVFTKDSQGVSNCTGNCATMWPPLTVADGVTPTGSSDVTGTLGVIKRADGTNQVTVNGWPLYHFSKDSKPGDIKGQGLFNAWFVVGASGKAMMRPLMQATPKPYSSGGYGGGMGGGGKGW